MLSPVLEELSDEFEGKVDIYKVNVDEEEELSAAFGIRSVPTLIFVPMNGAPQMSAGAPPKPQLKEAIERILL
jgi:thioredoxin-like negative regulator of GroEL